MSYDDVSRFAQSWGLVYLFVLFVVSLVYALWPRNRDKFRKAANMPLNDDPAPVDVAAAAAERN